MRSRVMGCWETADDMDYSELSQAEIDEAEPAVVVREFTAIHCHVIPCAQFPAVICCCYSNFYF